MATLHAEPTNLVPTISSCALLATDESADGMNNLFIGTHIMRTPVGTPGSAVPGAFPAHLKPDSSTATTALLASAQSYLPSLETATAVLMSCSITRIALTFCLHGLFAQPEPSLDSSTDPVAPSAFMASFEDMAVQFDRNQAAAKVWGQKRDLGNSSGDPADPESDADFRNLTISRISPMHLSSLRRLVVEASGSKGKSPSSNSDKRSRGSSSEPKPNTKPAVEQSLQVHVCSSCRKNHRQPYWPNPHWHRIREARGVEHRGTLYSRTRLGILDA
ncbi:hypothetical protein C8F04DRAFT_1399792 [Mycena alexandri]|uniref:Uncharacterized protein n=1 Tax=Mycena alexandri TaxID=1745969 RepID=A0AAD6SFX2_9AGAR|nr:hypothetical protein C8F04DRAFT_1399792 [Mycena alexandri]